MNKILAFSVSHKTPRRDHTSGFDDAQAIADKVNSQIMAQGVSTESQAIDLLNENASDEVQSLYGLHVSPYEVDLDE